MPTPPVDDSPRCVHCGYAKAGLEPDANACPECGHSLDETFIAAMDTPPRWFRIHRAGWMLFRYAGWSVLLAIAIVALAMIAVMIDSLTGDGSTTWSGHVVVIGIRYVAMGLIGLGVLYNTLGGVCCFATVPAESPRDHRKALLFSGISLAIPLLALPAIYAIAFQMAVPREIIFGCAILSIVLVSIDARLLPGRADAFVLFATNGAEQSFFDEGRKLIDAYGYIAAFSVIYLLINPNPNGVSLIVFLYLFAVISWVSRRARAARAVRKQIEKAKREAGSRRSRQPARPANSGPKPA